MHVHMQMPGHHVAVHAARVLGQVLIATPVLALVHICQSWQFHVPRGSACLTFVLETHSQHLVMHAPRCSTLLTLHKAGHSGFVLVTHIASFVPSWAAVKACLAVCVMASPMRRVQGSS